MHAGIKIKQMQQRDLNDSSQALRQAEQLQVRYATALKNKYKIQHKQSNKHRRV